MHAKIHKIYLDNAASTHVDETVVKAMLPFLTEKYGNASSLHSFGRDAKEALEEARLVIAKSLNAQPKEIIFTSGGTESNNLALQKIAYTHKNKGNHIITTKIEHDSVVKTCTFLENNCFIVTYLNVDNEGLVSVKELEKAITPKTILVSIIHGNNEIGTMQDLKSLYTICKKKGVYFHTDACQSYMKTPLSAHDADLISLNAHKLHGPKGVGALFVKEGTQIQPLMYGGGHERGLRPGTENVAGIVGFAKAVQLMNEKEITQMKKLRDYFIDSVVKEIRDCKVNGPRTLRLCNNIHLAFKHVEAESVLLHLDNYGIAVSTASACASQSLKASHVIDAIGLSEEYKHGTVRMSLSKYTTKEELDYTLKKLKEVVEKIRELNPLSV